DAGAVDLDHVAVRVDALPDLRRCAVDGHTSVGDQLFGFASRQHSSTRQRALDSHRLRHQIALGSARSATASSSARGNSSRWRSAKYSRKIGVVPYSSGRPIPSPRPTTSISPRSWSDLSTL